MVALTSAYPIRCVKLTLPPRARRRWLLMTVRLSESSFAGTARTLVAVGTSRDASMLVTTRAAAPFSGVLLAPVLTGTAAAGFGAGVAGAGAAGAAAAGATGSGAAGGAGG